MTSVVACCSGRPIAQVSSRYVHASSHADLLSPATPASTFAVDDRGFERLCVSMSVVLWHRAAAELPTQDDRRGSTCRFATRLRALTERL